MRIIAGKHKGRRITLAKQLKDVRPTSDFARQAVFNILMHRREGDFSGARVADLCCGSGAFGLEALSRGAEYALFSDADPRVLEAVRNLAVSWGEGEAVDFLRGDVAALPKSRFAYDMVFFDPPYHSGLIARALPRLLEGDWLHEGSILVLEQDEDEDFALPENFELLDERRYGRAMVRLLSLR